LKAGECLVVQVSRCGRLAVLEVGANRPQFGMPSVPTLMNTSAAFGAFGTTINTPRQFQFAARFSF